MLDITVIILTYNEEIHIRRCLENVTQFAKTIYVIDCYSTDRTIEIARAYSKVIILQNKWPGSQALQFNWALHNAPISTNWVLRLDADEYLLPDLIEELNKKIYYLSADISGIIFKRRHIFLGKWMKRGIYPVKLIRMFRYGKGLSEERLMDEHIRITEGGIIEFENDFCDHNLNDLSYFCHKHVNYAIREAAELLNIEYNLSSNNSLHDTIKISEQANEKRKIKNKYVNLPLFWRSFAYFIYRYFIKLGFLEGKEGFLWNFLQGWWYRTLVDAKIFEIKRNCGNDKEKIIIYLREHYHINI